LSGQLCSKSEHELINAVLTPLIAANCRVSKLSKVKEALHCKELQTDSGTASIGKRKTAISTRKKLRAALALPAD